MAYLLARNHINGGYMDVRPEDIPNELKNKRIIIEDLDSDGNLIETKTLKEDEKDLVLSALIAVKDNLYVSRKEDIELFNDEEVKIIKELMWRFNFFLTKEKIIELKNFFEDHLLEKIKFVLKLSDPNGQVESYFCTNLKNPLTSKKFTFKEALEFVEERKGIYYAINNKGEKKWDFIDKPTKKQAQYQRRKNSNKIAYLNFQDWKEYIILESEL